VFGWKQCFEASWVALVACFGPCADVASPAHVADKGPRAARLEDRLDESSCGTTIPHESAHRRIPPPPVMPIDPRPTVPGGGPTSSRVRVSPGV
jgi:hypothetical protein